MAFSETKAKQNFKKNLLSILFVIVAVMPIITFAIVKIANNPIPKITQAPETSKYLLEVANENYKAKIGSKKDNSASVQFINPEKKDITFSYISQDKRTPTVEKNSKKVVFKNVDKNTDLEYIPLENGLKENIILNGRPKSNYYYFATDIKDSIVKKHYKGDGVPAFYTEKGDYLFNIEPGYAVDASGKQTEDVKIDVIKSEGTHYLRVKVDEKWLTSENRKFPIKVDPTIIIDTSAELSAGSFNRSKDTGSGSNPKVETYFQELTSDTFTAGLWHMNEASGNIIDASGNGNTGTPTGTTVTNGLLSNARDFNGTTDYINVGSASILNITGDLTLEAWVKADSFASNPTIVSWANGSYSSFPYHMVILTTGQIRFNSTTTGSADSTGTVTTGTWNHVAVTLQSTNLQFYINGVLDSSFTVSSSTRLAGDTYATISRNGSQYFDGIIDEVRISSTARSAEEIKLSAGKRPYSVYTSEVIDLGTEALDWGDLVWGESGVLTGNAETLSDSTGLVAQWNFNETSGTTLNNNAGTCGASCNGTLTGFNSTSSQDANQDSSWTSLHKRWGGGALTFDGSDTDVSITDNNNLSFGNAGTDTPFSISTWINPRSVTTGSGTGNWIINKRNAGAGDEYQLVLYEGRIYASLFTNNTNSISKYSARKLTPGQWYNVVMTYDGSKSLNGINVYVNGKLEPTISASNGTYTGMNNGPANLVLGRAGWSSSLYFDGTIDSTFIIGRELPIAEIISNYQSSNLQLMTRVGNDDSPDDGGWEEWRPSTGETQMEAFDNLYMYDVGSTGLTTYWPLDETQNDTCTGGTNDVCDRTGSNDAVVSGTTIVDGAYGQARGFPGNSIVDYVSKPSYTGFPTTEISTEFWVKSSGSSDGIISYASTASDNDWLIYNSSNLYLYRGTTPLVTGVAIDDGRWHHIVVTWRSSDGLTKLYKNGFQVYSGNMSSGVPITGGGTLMLGQEQDSVGGGLSAAQSFKGSIDEVRIYNTVLGDAVIFENFTKGSTKINSITTKSESIVKEEGVNSRYLKANSLSIDGSTIGAWKLDETSGTGAYLKDYSGNGLHGTPTGTSLTKGVNSMARSFNGTSDIITIGDVARIDTATQLSACAWVNPNTLTADGTILRKSNSSTDGLLFWRDDVAGISGRLDTYTIFLADSTDTDLVRIEGAHNASEAKKWTHVCFSFITGNATGLRLYINGKEDINSPVSTAAIGAIDSGTNALTIGGGWGYLDGKLDDVVIWNKVVTPSEVLDLYEMGSNNYVSQEISDISLVNDSHLSLNIAGSRPGTYLQTIVGESAFANYQSDSNTLGLWHFDESTSYTDSFEDNSGKGNHIPFSSFSATGGTVTTVGGYRIHTFTSNGTFTPNRPGYVEVLVVGGGGGGGGGSNSAGNGAGGGAGSVKYNASLQITAATTATVGGGGAGGTSAGGVRGSNGGTSVFGSVTANGGGGGGAGGYSNANGLTGGNGGGGAPINAAAGTSNDGGYSGGAGSNCNTPCRSGGGGGAGAAGVSGVTGAGNGGIGVAYSITGTSIYYGGGGGGSGGTQGGVAGTGGLGGGGAGINFGTAGAGTANTGGGGGGGGYQGNGGGGGSGVVIARYPYQAGTTPIEGALGKGRKFNGTSEYLQSASNYNFTSGAFTISMWVNPTSLTNNPVIISNGAYNEGGYYMHLIASGGVQFVTNQSGASQLTTSRTGVLPIGIWSHISVVRSGSSVRIYVNGIDVTSTAATHVNPASTARPFTIGTYEAGPTTYFYSGSLDELRVDGIARTAEEIKQAYEVNRRSHTITIDFAAKLDSTNLITSGADYSFTIDATYYGLSNKGEKLYPGDSIIVSENYNGTEYIAQGKVTSVNTSTGAVTVTSWNAGSTFPPSGYSEYAEVFKWQKEYWAVHKNTLDSHFDNISVLTLRISDGTEAREIWVDDLKTTSGYLTSPAGSTITSSTGEVYFQYKVIETTNNYANTTSFNNLTIDYSTNEAPNIPSLDSPSDIAISQPLTPVLKTTATDVDLDYLRFKIEICEDIFMTQSCTTYDQTSSQTGWSGQNTETSTAYTNGTQATYTLQSELDEGKTYYWRSYAIDPGGINEWSSTQTTPFAFTVNARPRPNETNYKQHFIARRESSYPSSTTGWASINGASETGTTSSANGWIAGSNLTVGERYLVMVWGSHQADNTTAKSGLRVKHGATPFTESQAIETSNQSATSYKTPYFWFTVWTAANENLEVETYWSGNAGTESRVEDITLIAINAEDLIANGSLHYDTATTGGTLSQTYTPKATATFTTTQTSPWWIMGYSKADIVDIDSDKYFSRINLTSTTYTPVYSQIETTFGESSISGKDPDDTPIYGSGYAQEIESGVEIDLNIEIRESADNQEWEAAGVMALRLDQFDSYSYTKTSSSTTLSTPSAWVEQSQINPLNRFSSNYLIASGAIIDDAGTKTISRVQNSDSNITDDVGGWRQNSGDITSLTIADVYPNLTGGIKNIEMDSQSTLAGTATVDDRWMIGMSLEEPAHGPTLNSPTPGATNQNIRTQFKIVAHDPDNDSLMYKIDICSNVAMTANCQTINQQSSQTGWTGQNAFSNQRYASGTEATYTLQSDLTANTTYYWRASVIDPSGTNDFTLASSVRAFTTSQSPFQPSAIEIEEATNPTGVTDLTPEISALHTDPDTDSASNIRIQVSSVSNFVTTTWDTGKLIMTTTANNTRTPSLIYGGSSLNLNGQKYYLRMKLWDVKGAESAWSETATFQMHKLEPANGCHVTDTDPTDTSIIIRWNDNSALETGYRIQRSVNGGAFSTLTTKSANSTSHTDTISAGNTYRYRIATAFSSYFAAECTTTTADIKVGEVRIGGIKIEGIKID